MYSTEATKTISWEGGVDYANQTTENIEYPDITKGVWCDIELLNDGTGYVATGFTRGWNEQYQKQNGTWTDFDSDYLSVEFSGVDQSCRVILDAIPGDWQGPWQ